MDILGILIFLLFLFVFVTLIGHGVWLALSWFITNLFGLSQPEQIESLNLNRCSNCNALLHPQAEVCTVCWKHQPSPANAELMKEISATHRHLQGLYRQGRITEQSFRELMRALELERERLGMPSAGYAPPHAPPQPPQQPPARTPAVTTPPASVTTPPPPTFVSPEPVPTQTPFAPPVVTGSGVDESRTTTQAASSETVFEKDAVKPHVWAEEREPSESARPRFESPRPKFEPVAQRKPRKPLSEVLAAFMEQSNIRWGEIVGGLLIIGCSTALVISLWTEISRIPVLKFFIFTSVTALLFGVGLYTEHRWKLPTTSRGILTIATLLVPLNFLAIAAVSRGNIPPGWAIIASELIAPALFLCFVYFAGRIITSAWPHLLVFGVLGSSVGQLIIWHFAHAGMPPQRLLVLGLFPLICFVATTSWMLRRAAHTEEIDEGLANTIFITLGASTFAALLPLGLLSYKSGQTANTLMHLAPLLTLGGGPILASGLLLWQRIKGRELAASKTAGTSIALIGVMLALSGIFFSFPNPASVVLAASFAFVIFTGIAHVFKEPRVHLPAAFSFALAFIVTILAATGDVEWQSPRQTSLVRDLMSIKSGQAMAFVFALFIAASEVLRKLKQEAAARYYLIAAWGVGAVCLILMSLYRLDVKVGDPHLIAPIYAVLTAGAFWSAWRSKREVFGWIGSGVLLLTLVQTFGGWLSIRFPWQAALLAHASLTAIVAIICWRKGEVMRRVFAEPLNISALIASCAAVVFMFQSYRWQPTGFYAQRLYWLSAIWLVLLWLNRSQLLFTAMQVALTCAVLLTVKLGLQGYEWYAYVPHAWLHPWSLQIQGSVLVMLGLTWIALRIFVRSKVVRTVKSEAESNVDSDAVSDEPEDSRLVSAAWGYLNSSKLSFDQTVTWAVLCGFVLLGIYGALHGIKLELTIRGGAASVWNLARFPHEHAYGAGAWILLALLLVSMLASFWERRRVAYLMGAVVALSTVVPLLAARWETEFATASAWRWLAAIFLILVSLPVWGRDKIFGRLKSYGLPELNKGTDSIALNLRVMLLILTLVPLLALTIFPVLKALEYMPVHGPAAGFFYQIGTVISYSVPLLFAALALVGHALRERIAGYAFVAGLLLNLAVTVAQLLAVASVGGSMNRVVLVQVIQLNAIATGCFALVWLAVLNWWMRGASGEQNVLTEYYLKFQVGFGLVLNGLIIAPLVVWMSARPDWPGIATFEAGNLRGWLALLITLLAAFWFFKAFDRKLEAWLPFVAASAIGSLAAFDIQRAQSGTWAGYHTLLVASALTGWLMLLARKLPAYLKREEAGTLSETSVHKTQNFLAPDWKWDAALYASIAGAWTVLLALRAAPSDPAKPWWSMGALVAMSALAAGLNWETLSRAYLYTAGILLNLAASIWYITRWPYTENFNENVSMALGFIEANVIALALPGIVWLWLELRARPRREERPNQIPEFHALIAIIISGTMCVVVVFSLLIDLQGLPIYPRAWLEWTAMFSAIALMFACLWDVEAKYVVAGLYVLGLMTAGMALSRFNLSPSNLLWMMMLVAAAYALLTSFVWKSRDTFFSFAEQLKIPQRPATPLPGLRWLRIFNSTLTASVILLAFWAVLDLKAWPMRLAGAVAVLAQTLMFGTLAQGERRGRWQKVALAMFAVGVVYFGWSWLVPLQSGTWLNRAVVMMLVMFGLIVLYSIVTEKAFARESDWGQATRSLLVWFAGAGAVALVFVLCTEVAQQTQYGSVRTGLPAMIAVGATLLAASILGIFFAVRPAHDPLGLSESGRMNYVYVAEVLLALLFMHIRLTMPWLFTGFFQQYWPVVIVLLSFLGVGTSEILRRQGVLVVARPLERTGAFLPLLPVIGFWIIDSRVDYSLLLFMTGLLYASLSLLRSSFRFGVLAALAGNGGLWYMLHHTESYGFARHPQMWLIPIALSVLVAAYLNRKSFTEEQMTAIRYITLMMIYVSSTSDIFINGVAESPWLPLALAGLAVSGVLCGILLRVRAFLFLGSTFLLIAVITMIWYASDNLGWTWIWWVAGITTGALIFITFALFEKKRSEMLQMIEDLRGWER